MLIAVNYRHYFITQAELTAMTGRIFFSSFQPERYQQKHMSLIFAFRRISRIREYVINIAMKRHENESFLALGISGEHLLGECRQFLLTCRRRHAMIPLISTLASVVSATCSALIDDAVAPSGHAPRPFGMKSGRIAAAYAALIEGAILVSALHAPRAGISPLESHSHATFRCWRLMTAAIFKTSATFLF